MREFLHVDDLAEACFTCMKYYDSPEPINIGTGEDVTIKQLAETIAKTVGYDALINWDTSKPNGTPRKVLNVDKIKTLGWEPKIGLEEGIKSTYHGIMISFNNLGNLGRLANQMFQYASLRVLLERINILLQFLPERFLGR